MPESNENESKHQYPPTKFPPPGRSVNRPNSYTSTTRADLISSTTRSRDTHRIPANVLDLSNEFAQPSPSPEHSSQYSSTIERKLSPTPSVPPDYRSTYEFAQPSPSPEHSSQHSSTIQSKLLSTPSGPPDYRSTYTSQMESQIPFSITNNYTRRDNQHTSYQLPFESGASLPSESAQTGPSVNKEIFFFPPGRFAAKPKSIKSFTPSWKSNDDNPGRLKYINKIFKKNKGKTTPPDRRISAQSSYEFTAPHEQTRALESSYPLDPYNSVLLNKLSCFSFYLFDSNIHG